MRIFGEIRRIDEEQRMVWGYASTPNKAADGMTITLDAMRGALEDYMAFANIREMHQLSAVGRAEEASVDDGGLYVGAKVVDDSAWKKITEKVYRGFSIGAKITARDPDDKNTITGIMIREISLVDRPGDSLARFDVWRAANFDEENDMADDADLERRNYTEGQRMEMAKSGEAMKDGSFPIKDRADLENAIRAWGRAKNKASAKKHILKRAKALNAEDLIPAEWKDSATRAAGAEGSAETDDLTEETEEVEHVEGAAAADDLVTRATQAAAAALVDANTAIERVASAVHPEAGAAEVVRAELPNAEIRRGLSMVNRLGWLVGELAYIVMDAQWEAEIEGDNSPVPGKLRGALLEVAKAYKAMSDEELAELLKGVNVDVALENGVILMAATGADLERLNQAHADVLKRLGLEAPAPIAPAADPAHADEIARLSASVDSLTSDREELLRTVGDLTTQVTGMTARLDKLAEEPMPAKTAANTMARAVSKEGDATGQDNQAQPPITSDGVQRYLESLPENERALLLIRAAHAHPVAITHR